MEMNRQLQQLKGCEGKKKFLSFKDAHRALSAAMRHDGAPDMKMGVYRCRFCAHFHIGHARSSPAKTKKLQQARRA